MEKKEFDTIYEKILAAVLKVMYEMKKAQLSGESETLSKNFYDMVYNQVKNSKDIEYPTIQDINDLYKKIDLLEKEEKTEL